MGQLWSYGLADCGLGTCDGSVMGRLIVALEHLMGQIWASGLWPWNI